ncbi:MAG: hypothetical protein IJ723_04775 [Ruminococcus sp.]|nr:hypothetical protein [Ruminococcus sp.]
MLGKSINGRDLPREMSAKGTSGAFASLDADGRQQLSDSLSKPVPETETEELPYSSGDRLYPEGYYL